MVGLAVAAWFLVPWVVTALNTVSTDDAYVNGHVTFVAPRVAGQVTKVLVDDNYRVKKGDVLVQLDKEPYQVQVAIKKAAVAAAEADLAAAKAQVRGQVAQTRANRFKLEHAIEDVNNQIANLRAAVATLNSKKATLDLAKANLKRGEELAPGGGISKEDLDQRRQTVKVDEAAVEQALQQVYAIRVGLGLPAEPPKGQDLTDVPPDLDQNFSGVRQALGTLLQSAAQLGYFPTSWNATPKQAIEDFYKQDPEGNLDRIYAKIIPKAPAIKQAEAKLLQAHSDLDQAELNLRYCDVVSEIDGVVTSRNVNPGNNVQAGQSLMAVRSLTEIWIDANFKETQLADLRIGQRVALRGGHVRQPAGVRGPHHRLHHGHRPDPRPAAAAERHGQLRQDRPAAAGPHRADRLRPRQGSLCSSACRSRRTCTTRSRPTGPHAGKASCSRLRPLPQAPHDPKP